MGRTTNAHRAGSTPVRAGMLNRVAKCLLVVATAALAAGCGNNGHTVARSTAARPLTAAQAVAIADAISLTPADLPGYTATPNHTLNAGLRADAQLAACVGGIDPSQAIADVPSDDFVRGSGLQMEQLQSVVSVWPSASLTARNLAADTNAKAPSCLAQSLLREIVASSPSLLKDGTPSVTRIATPAGAQGGSYGYRIALAVTATGETFHIYQDVLAFRSGAFEIALSDTRIGQPVQSGVETRLYSLLVSRANAHPPVVTVIKLSNARAKALIKQGDKLLQQAIKQSGIPLQEVNRFNSCLAAAGPGLDDVKACEARVFPRFRKIERVAKCVLAAGTNYTKQQACVAKSH